MTPDTQQRRQFLWFFGIAFIVLAAGIGLRDPWPADEPRFVLVARQMWDSGEWLFPHRGRELYPDKPPLYFWLLGAAYAVVRSWRWAFLLPSLLAALATLALTYDLGRRLWSHRTGMWAATAVMFAAQFVYHAKRAQIDPVVTCFITLGVYGILRHILLGPNWRWYWLGCFAAGLGVISKGVGFLALLALLPYAWMRWRGWNGLTPPARGNGGRWALGALAFLAAIAVWFVPMLATALAGGDPEHRAYLDELLFRQTATRYVNAWHHHAPWWYFLGVIAGFWLPFSLALPALAPRWRDAWCTRDARVWLPLAWALLVLLFFSASPGKRDMYILPMLPMVALAAAP
ncbi:MAG: glycosyltransferase family 39 protein, partial [Luteimonas sp.]